MERELELVRRELEILRSASLRDPSAPAMPARAERVKPSRQPKVNINVIAELLPPFSGADGDFDRWERQLKLLKATYELDDKFSRVLLGSKLKGKALDWLYSKV